MTFKLRSLQLFDSLALPVADAQHGVRVEKHSTVQSLISLSPSPPLHAEAVGLTLARGGAAHKLHTRGAVLAVQPDDADVPLSVLIKRASAPGAAGAGAPGGPAGAGGSAAALSHTPRGAVVDGVEVGETRLRFRRAFRAAEDGTGVVAPYARNADDYEVVWPGLEGGAPIVALHQCEALALSFATEGTCAVKIGYDGYNAVTGEEWRPGYLSRNPQNYFVVERDGLVVGVKRASDRVGLRQLVAPPITLGAGEVAQAVAGTADAPESCELHVEVFPLQNFDVWLPRKRKMLDAALYNMTPRMLGFLPGEKLVYFSDDLREMGKELTLEDLGVRGREDVQVHCRQRNIVRVRALGMPMMAISVDRDREVVGDLMKRVELRSGVPSSQQQLMFCGVALDPKSAIQSAGLYDNAEVHLVSRPHGETPVHDKPVELENGRILQRFEADTLPLKRFSSSFSSAVFEVVDSVGFACRAGTMIPPSPLVRAVYEQTQGSAFAWEPFFDDDAAASGEVARGLCGQGGPPAVFGAGHADCLCDGCERGVAGYSLTPCEHGLCESCVERIEEVGAETPAGGQKLLICPLCQAQVFLKKRESCADENDDVEGESESEKRSFGPSPFRISELTEPSIVSESVSEALKTKARRSVPSRRAWRRSYARARRRSQDMEEKPSEKTNSSEGEDGQEGQIRDSMDESAWFS